MDIRLNKVREHINLYFRENLPQYTILQRSAGVPRQSLKSAGFHSIL